MKTFITTALFCLLFSMTSLGQLTTITNEIHITSGRDNIRHSFSYKNQYAFVDGNYRGMLWLSDGTKAGTRIISTSANNQGAPVVIQDKIILVDYDWDNMKYDLYSVTENSRILLVEDITRFSRMTSTDSIAFFFNNNALWRTDGTAAGTYSIEPFVPNPSSGYPNLHVIGDYVFFNKNDNAYRTNGVDGIELLKPTGDDFGGFFAGGVFFNGIYIFSSNSENNGMELWRTDFTDAGTYMLKDLAEGKLSYDTTRAISSSPGNFKLVGNQIFFTANRGQIWITDGTDAGTQLVKNLWRSEPFTGYAYFDNDVIISALNGKYIFSIITDDKGHELWTSDGTEVGTQMIKDINEGTGNFIRADRSSARGKIIQHNNYLYFSASNGIHGEEIWRTDGTVEGTTMVYDILPGMRSSRPDFFEITNDDLFFTSRIPSADTVMLTLLKLDLNDLDGIVIPNYNYDIEWYRQIGSPPSSSSFNNTYSAEMAIDSKNAIYTTGTTSYSSKGLFVHQTGTRIPYDTLIGTSFQNHITKFKPNGEVEWAQPIGGSSYGLQGPVVTVDTEDNVIVGTSFFRKGSFGGVVVNTPNNYIESVVIAQLDEAGNFKWWSEGHGLRLELYDITTDKENNIYALMAFRGYSINWNGEPIRTDKEEGSAILVKLDKNGNSKWVKELEGNIDWSRGAVKIKNEEITIMLSEGDMNIWSSCEYTSWNFLLAKYQTNGTAKWSKLMQSNDLSYLTGMDINSNREILVTGRFRGQFDFGGKTIESPQGEYCSFSTGFVARFDDEGNFINVLQDDESDIIPFQIITKDDHYYLLNIEYFDDYTSYEGYLDYRVPNNDKKLVIKKYDYLNNLQNVKSFNKTGSFRDDWYENDPKMLFTSDGYALISDNIQGYLDTMPYYVQSNGGNINMMLMKLKWEETKPLKIFEDEVSLQLKLIPNPASDFTYVKILDEGFNQFDLTIYNISGQQVDFQQKTNDFNYYRVDVQQLAAGTYIFHFNNNQGKQMTIKFIKI